MGDEHILECVDWDFPGEEKRRILVDAGRREVVFINCLWPRRFFSNGYEAYHCCAFDDVLSAREFGMGQLRRLYIATRQGRCAVSAEWDGYEELVRALTKIASASPGGPLLDDPRVLLPLLGAIVFWIVGVMIWLLL